MFRRIRRLNPDSPISCAEMNRAFDLIERNSRLAVNPASALRLVASAAGNYLDLDSAAVIVNALAVPGVQSLLNANTIPGAQSIFWNPALKALTVSDGTTLWCLAATPCPNCSGSASGSGSSGSGGSGGGGGSGVQTTCCPGVLVPATLFATFSGSACPNLDGQTVQLTVSTFGGSPVWSGEISGGLWGLSVVLQCYTTQWALTLQCGGVQPYQAVASSSSCAPFTLTFDNMYTGNGAGVGSGCCAPESSSNGPFTVTVFQ
jgi:hypothetical protein